MQFFSNPIRYILGYFFEVTYWLYLIKLKNAFGYAWLFWYYSHISNLIFRHEHFEGDFFDGYGYPTHHFN
jgi:hypothetical protein